MMTHLPTLLLRPAICLLRWLPLCSKLAAFAISAAAALVTARWGDNLVAAAGALQLAYLLLALCIESQAAHLEQTRADFVSLPEIGRHNIDEACDTDACAATIPCSRAGQAVAVHAIDARRAIGVATGRSGTPIALHYAAQGGADALSELLCSLRAQASASRQVERQLSKVLDEVFAAAVEQERERIARELHDGVAQNFLIIKMLLASGVNDVTHDVTQSAMRLAEHGLAETRRLIRALCSGFLASKTLDQAVRDMASATVPPGVDVRIESVGDWGALDGALASELFRVIQEAVTNAVKHAKAKQLCVDLSCNHREAVALVSDDGVGFELVQRHRDDHQGIGLLLMRQRAERIGATLEVITGSGKGTHVHVSMGLEGSAVLHRSPTKPDRQARYPGGGHRPQCGSGATAVSRMMASGVR